VIGHGGWFLNNELTPAKEKLLVDTCNWLVRRDDAFIRKESEELPAWRFPRVPLDREQRTLWSDVMVWGLPGLFVFLGFAVLLFRRLR
jgi:hypothetical protein